MTETNARRLLGIAFPVMTLAVIVIPYLLARSELPDRVATHFDVSGTPDGSMTAGWLIVLTVALAGLGLAGCVWLALQRDPLPEQLAPTVGFLGGFFAGLFSGISLVTFTSQRGNETWSDASSVWAVIVVPIVLGIAAGALAAWLATKLPRREFTHAASQQPTMQLAEGEHAVWTETLHSKLLMRLGVITMVAGVLIAVATLWWLLVPTVLSGVVTVSLATLRVRADRYGLHVRYGLLPWPRTTIEIGDITQATVIDVRPMEWGGWGYRGSLKLMKRAAVVHRAGPGLRLDLRNDKIFVVTVDGPEQPVALLNAEVARATASAQG